MKNNFEQYLGEQFLKEYHGDKDHYENAFESWLSKLEIDDWLNYGDNFKNEK